MGIENVKILFEMDASQNPQQAKMDAPDIWKRNENQKE